MRTLPFLIGLVFILSACDAKVSTETKTTQTPYPSTPLSASGTFIDPPAPTTTDSYEAKGTEPFWSVEVKGGSAVLSKPGTGSVSTSNFNVIQDDKGAIISIRSTKGDFFLTLVKSECSDGMSNMKYRYSSTLNVGSEVLRGCANKK